MSTQWTIQTIGGGFLLAAFLLDCLDGDLARLKELKSPVGAMLDPILDRCSEIVVILGISINGWRTTADPLWLIGGLILVGMSQLYFYMTDAMLNIYRKKAGELENNNGKKLFGTRVRFGAIEPFVWGQACLAFAGVPYWGIVIFGIMFSIFCAMQFYRLFTIPCENESDESKKFEVHVW